jgi:hypothetical protein
VDRPRYLLHYFKEVGNWVNEDEDAYQDVKELEARLQNIIDEIDA